MIIPKLNRVTLQEAHGRLFFIMNVVIEGYIDWDGEGGRQLLYRLYDFV